eukprot:UN00413
MAPSRRKHQHAMISKTTDNILTGLYFALTAYSVWNFYNQREDHQDLWVFLASCLIVIVAIKVTEFLTRVVARDFFSAKLLNSGPHPNPLAKPKAFSKFTGTCWQLVIHLSMTMFELYVLWDEPWLSHPYTTFVPVDYKPKDSLRYFYIFQIAIWIITCFSHRFNSDAHAHKDYVIMYVHHLATIALVAISFAAGQTRIGTVVLFVHDVSDIGIDFLKLSNYLAIEGPQHFFAVEAAYFFTMVMWFYYRLWYFPYYLIWNGPVWGLGFLGPSVHGDLPVVEQFSPEQLSSQLFVGWTSLCLLVLLFLMHIWWFFLLFRIFLRMLTAKAVSHQAGAEEYEGNSDDEDDHEQSQQQQQSSSPAIKQQQSAVEEEQAAINAVKTKVAQRKSRKE